MGLVDVEGKVEDRKAYQDAGSRSSMALITDVSLCTGEDVGLLIPQLVP